MSDECFIAFLLLGASILFGIISTPSKPEQYPKVKCTMVGEIRQAYWGRPSGIRKLSNGNVEIYDSALGYFECEDLMEFK